MNRTQAPTRGSSTAVAVMAAALLLAGALALVLPRMWTPAQLEFSPGGTTCVGCLCDGQGSGVGLRLQGSGADGVQPAVHLCSSEAAGVVHVSCLQDRRVEVGDGPQSRRLERRVCLSCAGARDGDLPSGSPDCAAAQAGVSGPQGRIDPRP